MFAFITGTAMTGEIADKDRGVLSRTLTGSVPVKAADRGVETRGTPSSELTRILSRLTETRVFRYERPDGSPYDLEWKSETGGARARAQAWAYVVGHKLISEVPGSTQERPLSPPPLVKAQTAKPEFSPPPLVEANPWPKPKRKLMYSPPPLVQADPFNPNDWLPWPAPQPPVPRKKQPMPIKPEKPDEKYGILDYLKDDFIHTTMTESLPLMSEWFGRVGKGLGYVPGLQGVGKAYEAIGETAGALNLIYELVHEMNQAEAFEKGSKELVKRVKPVKKIAEALVKKKYPRMPEAARKKIAEFLENWFEKYGTDPAIKKLREKAQEQDEGKELERKLYERLKNAFTPIPILK